MGLPVQADDHSGELPVRKDELALAVMAVDEHLDGLECDVEGHGALHGYRRERTSLSATSAWETITSAWETMLVIRGNAQ